jgi:hypothetical protein
MDQISDFLNVRDAISNGRGIGTKIGVDYIYENLLDDDGEGYTELCNCVDKMDPKADFDDICECDREKEITYKSLMLGKLGHLINESGDLKSFCCGGILPDRLNVSVGSQEKVGFSKLDVETLEKEGKPAPFGDLNTMETKIDPSVRTALELPFTYDIISPRMKEEIEYKLNNGNKVEIVSHKANIYHKGGFFKPHVDTPISDDMLGTLVITLPTTYEGGDLIIQHGDTKRIFNYNGLEQELYNFQFGWAAFYGNCVHEVTPVTSGTRVTFTFYIMNKNKNKQQNKITKIFGTHMKKTVACIKKFGKKGNKYVGLFAQHRYTMNGVNKLKGIDEDVYNYLKSVGSLSVQVLPVLVYYSQENYHSQYDDKETKADVIACTEKDFNFFQGKSEKQVHDLPEDIPFVGKLMSGRKIRESSQSFIEYTGNESQPYSYDGIYLSAVMIVKIK